MLVPIIFRQVLHDYTRFTIGALGESIRLCSIITLCIGHGRVLFLIFRMVTLGDVYMLRHYSENTEKTL